MRKLSFLLLIHCFACIHGNAQCLIPRYGGDTVIPVTGNFNFDSTLGWQANTKATIFNIARTANRYYVYGAFTNIGPNNGSGVIVDSASKTLITSNAWKINGYVRAAVPDGQGGFFIGGDFTQVGDSSRSHIAQIDPTGRPTAWNPGVDQIVYTLYKRNDTLFMGGSFSSVAHQNRRCFAAWSPLAVTPSCLTS